MLSCFKDYWSTAVFKLRWLFILLLPIWTIFAATHAFNLSPLTTPEEFIPKSHRYLRAFDVLKKFEVNQREDQELWVSINFGVSESIDKTGVHIWNESFYGTIKADA